MHEEPGGLLDEDDVKIRMGFKDCFYNEIVFMDVL